MADPERYKAALKLGGQSQWEADLRHVFSATGYAEGQGYNVTVDRVALKTQHPIRLDIDDGRDHMTTEVLTAETVADAVDLDIGAMLSTDPTQVSPLHASIRSRLGIIPGATMDAATRELVASVLGEAYQRLAGFAIISSPTAVGLATARDFYEDTRTLGHIDTSAPNTDS